MIKFGKPTLKTKLFKIAGLTALLALGVLYGICSVLYQWPPYSLLRLMVVTKNQKQYYEIPKVNLETDVAKLISIHQPKDIFRLRAELINFLWGKDKLPSSIPSKIFTDFNDDRYDDISSLSRIDKLSVMMEFELESHAYHFIPKTPNNKIVLYHQGHSGDFYKSKENITKLLDDGYSVVGFSMPLLGLNNKRPTINFKRFGKIKISN